MERRSTVYETIARRVNAWQWDGFNERDVASHLPAADVIITRGHANVEHGEARFLVKVADGNWAQLQPGWWVSLGEDEGLTVHSNQAFKRNFREV